MTEYLPYYLTDSAEAPEGLQRASKSLSPQELCSLIMRVIPQEWQDQYRLMADSSLVPVDVEKLLLSLQKIETLEQNCKRRIKNGGDCIPKMTCPNENGGGSSNNGNRRKKSRGNGDRNNELCKLCAKYGGGRPQAAAKDQMEDFFLQITRKLDEWEK